MQVIENTAMTIKEIWNDQHPVIHGWFVISGVSLCFMTAFMFWGI